MNESTIRVSSEDIDDSSLFISCVLANRFLTLQTAHNIRIIGIFKHEVYFDLG